MNGWQQLTNDLNKCIQKAPKTKGLECWETKRFSRVSAKMHWSALNHRSRNLSKVEGPCQRAPQHRRDKQVIPSHLYRRDQPACPVLIKKKGNLGGSVQYDALDAHAHTLPTADLCLETAMSRPNITYIESI